MYPFTNTEISPFHTNYIIRALRCLSSVHKVDILKPKSVPYCLQYNTRHTVTHIICQFEWCDIRINVKKFAFGNKEHTTD